MNLSTGAKRRDFLRAAGALGATALAPAVLGQTPNWPNKPVRIVVTFPPGGLTDAYARHYAEFLGGKLGHQVLVENKPGGGAIIGIDLVAKSPPDGHTLLMTTSGTVWQNRVLYSKLPYNLDKDLTPIAFFPAGPLVVGVPEKLGIGIQGVYRVRQENPTSMGTYAPGSYPHMVADQTNRAEGTQIQPVHYRGEAAMWVDVAGGQLQIAVGSYQAFNTVSTRGVRAIGVTGTYRSPKLPDVPTLVEQGIQGRLVTLEGGLPLLAPSGTPEAVLQTLSRAVVDGLTPPTRPSCVKTSRSRTSPRTWPRRARIGSATCRCGSSSRSTWASSWIDAVVASAKAV